MNSALIKTNTTDTENFEKEFSRIRKILDSKHILLQDVIDESEKFKKTVVEFRKEEKAILWLLVHSISLREYATHDWLKRYLGEKNGVANLDELSNDLKIKIWTRLEKQYRTFENLNNFFGKKENGKPDLDKLNKLEKALIWYFLYDEKYKTINTLKEFIGKKRNDKPNFDELLSNDILYLWSDLVSEERSCSTIKNFLGTKSDGTLILPRDIDSKKILKLWLSLKDDERDIESVKMFFGKDKEGKPSLSGLSQDEKVDIWRFLGKKECKTRETLELFMGTNEGKLNLSNVNQFYRMIIWVILTKDKTYSSLAEFIEKKEDGTLDLDDQRINKMTLWNTLSKDDERDIESVKMFFGKDKDGKPNLFGLSQNEKVKIWRSLGKKECKTRETLELFMGTKKGKLNLSNVNQFDRVNLWFNLTKDKTYSSLAEFIEKKEDGTLDLGDQRINKMEIWNGLPKDDHKFETLKEIFGKDDNGSLNLVLRNDKGLVEDMNPDSKLSLFLEVSEEQFDYHSLVDFFGEDDERRLILNGFDCATVKEKILKKLPDDEKAYLLRSSIFQKKDRLDFFNNLPSKENAVFVLEDLFGTKPSGIINLDEFDYKEKLSLFFSLSKDDHDLYGLERFFEEKDGKLDFGDLCDGDVVRIWDNLYEGEHTLKNLGKFFGTYGDGIPNLSGLNDELKELVLKKLSKDDQEYILKNEKDKPIYDVVKSVMRKYNKDVDYMKNIITGIGKELQVNPNALNNVNSFVDIEQKKDLNNKAESEIGK